MAVAVASKTVVNPGLGIGISFTNPTGLSVGDLMIVFIGSANGGSPSIDYSTPTGWTLHSQSKPSDAEIWFYSKVATSDDVSAGSVAFTESGDDETMRGGVMFRITGHASLSDFGVAGANDSATPSFNNGKTPAYANSLLLLFIASRDNTTGASASGYAIATNNPTWTEEMDAFAENTSETANDLLISCASALRPETSATGNSSVTLASMGAGTDSAAFLVVIPPQTNVTVSPSVITMAASIQAPTVTGGATVSPAVITMTASIQAPTVTTAAPLWSNTSKNSSNWTNQSKS